MTFVSGDIITDELFIPSFGYNSMEPYFFSRYYAEKNPGRYDVKLWEAMTASGSVPAGFNPKTLTNGYGQKDELIDGGVICNSPGLYAYFHAKHMLGKKTMRVLSLGTALGQTKEEMIAEDSEHDPTTKLANLNA